MSRTLGFTRFNEFVRFDQEQVEDVEMILETSGETADLYRPTYSGNPGFDTEVGNEQLVDRFLVHITRQSHGLQNAGVSTAEGGINVSTVRWVALTTNKSCQLGDVLVVANTRYKIKEIVRTIRGKSELVMEVIE